MANFPTLTGYPNGLSIWGPVTGGAAGIPVLPSEGISYFGNNVWFVDTVNGSDGNSGTGPNSAFKTMGRAFWTDYNTPEGAVGAGAKVNVNLNKNDTIYFVGTVREQLVAPLNGRDGTTLTGVQIVGDANGGVRDDNGAKWTYPASGAVAGGALLAVTQQGWVVSNFLMTPEPNGGGGTCIELRNTGDAVTGEGGHFVASGMRFVGIDQTTTYGIRDIGGCGFVKVLNCQFLLLTTGIYVSATPIAIPLCWQVSGNRFIDNTNHINGSFTSGVFENNAFVTEAAININLIAVSAQGATNLVAFNTFKNLAADITPSDGWTGSSTDQWTGNYATDAVVFGVPT